MKYTVLASLRAITTEQLADIALTMAEEHPDTFERLLLAASPVCKRTTYLVPNTISHTVSFTDRELDVLRSFGNREKIACIKQIREYAGIGLKEAKDLCEHMFPELKSNI